MHACNPVAPRGPPQGPPSLHPTPHQDPTSQMLSREDSDRDPQPLCPGLPGPSLPRHPAWPQCILEPSHSPVCFLECPAARPQSPASSDTPRAAPSYSPRLKQMLSTAARVQEDPRGPSVAPGRLAPFEPTVPPPVGPQSLCWPQREPCKDNVRCFLPRGSGTGGGGGRRPAQRSRLCFSGRRDQGPS